MFFYLDGEKWKIMKSGKKDSNDNGTIKKKKKTKKKKGKKKKEKNAEEREKLEQIRSTFWLDIRNYCK